MLPESLAADAGEGRVAQWLEPTAHNGLVAGSSPAAPTNPHSPSVPASAAGIFDVIVNGIWLASEKMRRATYYHHGQRVSFRAK